MDYRNIEIDGFWPFCDLHDLVDKNAQGLQLHTHLGFIVEMSNNNYMQKKVLFSSKQGSSSCSWTTINEKNIAYAMKDRQKITEAQKKLDKKIRPWRGKFSLKKSAGPTGHQAF